MFGDLERNDASARPVQPASTRFGEMLCPHDRKQSARMAKIARLSQRYIQLDIKRFFLQAFGQTI
jgi:hypothetical protein